MEKNHLVVTYEASFRQSETLKKHLRTHSGETPFQCDICRTSFSESGTLKRHLRTHSAEKNIQVWYMLWTLAQCSVQCTLVYCTGWSLLHVSYSNVLSTKLHLKFSEPACFDTMTRMALVWHSFAIARYFHKHADSLNVLRSGPVLRLTAERMQEGGGGSFGSKFWSILLYD